MKIFLIILLYFSINCVDNVASTSISCEYFDGWRGYTCALIFNAKYANEITQINGEHADGRSDNDLLNIFPIQKSNLTSFPTLLCEKFINLRHVHWRNDGFEGLDENSLKNCENLELLDLYGNKIRKLDENTFAHQSKLKELILGGNQIEELPENVFAPLKNLVELNLYGNKLKTLHLDSFGEISNLKRFRFNKNQLESFDERIIDNNNFEMVYAGPNPCVDVESDIPLSTFYKHSIKSTLKKCIDNFNRDIVLTTEDNELTPEVDNSSNSYCNYFYNLKFIMILIIFTQI